MTVLRPRSRAVGAPGRSRGPHLRPTCPSASLSSWGGGGGWQGRGLSFDLKRIPPPSFGGESRLVRSGVSVSCSLVFQSYRRASQCAAGLESGGGQGAGRQPACCPGAASAQPSPGLRQGPPSPAREEGRVRSRVGTRGAVSGRQLSGSARGADGPAHSRQVSRRSQPGASQARGAVQEAVSQAPRCAGLPITAVSPPHCPPFSQRRYLPLPSSRWWKTTDDKGQARGAPSHPGC